MSNVQEKYKIYLKHYCIWTECFLMQIEIDVEVVKSKGWPLKKNLETERKKNIIAWTSETEDLECINRSALVAGTENRLASCIMLFVKIHNQLILQ